MCWSLFLIMLQAYRLATFLKKDSNTDVFLWILQTLRTPKNIWERLLASDSSYILHRKLNKIIQEPEWPFFLLKHKSLHFTFSHSNSFVLTLAVIRRHSLSFLLRVVIRCHSFSIVVIRCHLLHHSLSLVVIFWTSPGQLLSLVVIHYTTRCQSLSLFL